MIPTRDQGTFKVKSAGSPEILLNALTKSQCILNKKTPMFNMNLIQEKKYTFNPGKIQQTLRFVFRCNHLAHDKKKGMSHSSAQAVTTFSIQGTRFDIIQPV